MAVPQRVMDVATKRWTASDIEKDAEVKRRFTEAVLREVDPNHQPITLKIQLILWLL